MDIRDLEGMEEITFEDISLSDFEKKENKFLLREEAEGVQVGLSRTKYHDAKKAYRVVVMKDGEELYSIWFRNRWEEAYSCYKSQQQFVRGLFCQSGRKPVFYYRDKFDNVVSVKY